MTSLLMTSERGALALFAGIWHGAVLLVVVAIALRLMPRLTAATRSLIWTAALMVIVALPFIPVHQVAGTAGRGLQLAPGWSLAVAAIWLGLSLVRGIQLVMSGARLRTIWAGAEVVAGSEVFHVKTAIGIERTAVLCVSDAIARPSVIGFFSPRILIPADLYGQLSAGEIEQIVLHEMEHLRRGDDWRNLLQKVAVMLFPLNPALLWIERRLCFERELACDESVLAQTQAPKSYAACLVHLAESHRIGRQISLALGAWERRSELTRRVYGILASPGRMVASPRMRFASAGVLTVGMVAIAGGLTRAPQLVSFAAAPTFAHAPMSAAGFENVSMRQRVPAPRMVETVMRMPAAVRAPVKKMIRIKVTRKPQLRVVSELRAAPARAVLTSWDDARQPVRAIEAVQREDAPTPRRITYAIFEFSSYSSETAQTVHRLVIVQL